MFFIVAVRKVAAGHRIIVEGWELFEEAVEEGTPGDLPALLQQLKGKTTPPPPTSVDLTQDTPATTPSPGKKVKIKRTGQMDQPVVVLIGGSRSWACPQCNTVRGSKNGCDAHIRMAHTGKALVCAFCSFSTYNMDSLQRHEKEHK